MIHNCPESGERYTVIDSDLAGKLAALLSSAKKTQRWVWVPTDVFNEVETALAMLAYDNAFGEE